MPFISRKKLREMQHALQEAQDCMNGAVEEMLRVDAENARLRAELAVGHEPESNGMRSLLAHTRRPASLSTHGTNH